MKICLSGEYGLIWYLTMGSLNMFFHPTLEYLTVQRMETRFLDRPNRPLGPIPPIENLRSITRFTPLKTLILEECTITNDGLGKLLSFQRALEELELGKTTNIPNAKLIC